MPSGDVIRSAANPLIKRLRLLSSDRRARAAEGRFVVDGVAAVWRGLDARVELEMLMRAERVPVDSAAQRLLTVATERDLPIATVANDLLSRISGMDRSAGVMAIAAGRAADLDTIDVAAGGLVVALHEIGNPGNLGTILRTAESAGASSVVAVGASTDFFSPAAVKASMGAIFDLQLGQADSLDEFFDWAKRDGRRVITTSARAAHEHWDADWAPPVALLLGSEGDGLAPDVIARGDLQVRIPMAGNSTSLNLAVAAGLLIFEARRGALAGRGAAGGRSLNAG